MIRPMRGRSRAQLVQAGDGNYYVVKSPGNPQGTESLINDMIAMTIFKSLSIGCPRVTTVEVDAPMSGVYESVPLYLAAGVHFGSAVAVDPIEQSIYDFLPAPVLARVWNLDSFTGALIADRWMANIDTPQAVFHFTQTSGRDSAGIPTRILVALHIDRGEILGKKWRFKEAPTAGVYIDHGVYVRVRSWADIAPWIGQIEKIGPAAISKAIKAIPEAWLREVSRNALDAALEQLERRIHIIPDLMRSLIASPNSPFRRWRETDPTAMTPSQLDDST